MSELEARPSRHRTSAEPEAITTEQRSQFRMVVRRFLRHRLAVGSLILLLLVFAFAFLGPLLWAHDHTIVPGAPSSSPPSWDHPFGTTNAGHDVFGQVMRGTQQSLKVAVTVATLSTTIGSLWGAIAGLYGGRIDNLMMRTVDVILVMPILVVVTAVAGNVRGGTSWLPVALVMSAFIWTTTARIVRGVVLSLREQEFIEAARAMGASNIWLVVRHLLPNASGSIIVAGTLTLAVAILLEAALSFLGFGIQPPDISLGQLINQGVNAAFTRPWLFYPSGMFIVLIALTINFIGDGLRDALDPRQTLARR